MSNDFAANALRQQAKTHIEQRDWAAAGACLRKLLNMFPGSPEILIQLSYMDSLAGHYRSARQSALDASQKPPADIEALNDLMARLRTFNEIETLEKLIRGMGPKQHMPIQMLVAVAAQLSFLNQQERALEFLDEAKRGDPEYPPTLVARAQVLTYLGRFDEALKDVRRAVKRAPQIAQAYLLPAKMRRSDDGGKNLQAILRELQRPGRKSTDIALLFFAAHFEFDGIGEHDRSWTALMNGCEAKRSTLSYSIEEGRALIDALVDFEAPVTSSDLEHEGTSSCPTFIVGMHRSGTTLLEQLLDGHPDVLGVGELYDFTSCMRYATDYYCRGVIDRTLVERAPSVDFAEVGRRYLDGMRWRLSGQRLFTDKLPSNFLNIGFIARALPRARILHMSRDPVETCFSNLRELFSDANPYSYRLDELADFYLQYRRLMRHWHEQFPGRILDVSYAELTRNPEVVMRRVANFCGLQYVPQMADPKSSRRAVATASAIQVRDRVIRRERPKWAPYRKHLAPLIDALRAGGVELAEPDTEGL